MSRQKSRSISRRDTLKVCLVPVGALTTHWLVGCADDSKPAAGSGPQIAGAQATSQAGAGVAGTAPATTSGAGTAPNAAIGGSGPGTGSAGTGVQANAGSAAQPSAGSAGTAQPPRAGSAGGGNAGASGNLATNGGSGGNLAAGNGGGGAGAGAQAGSGAVAGPGVPWASGGTKTMQGGYPDPFTSGSTGAACVVYPAQTLGPCYAQMPATRPDISDGIGGLPVRLSFLVVHANACMPVPDASIDIWHSGSDGIYSAYATGTICNPGTQDVRSMMFCRGVQTTDAQGRADFSTVFPGWYTGRTIHIHFTLRVAGREYVTSQIYFEDALTEEILAQGDYKTRGKRDTTNATDSLFRSGGASPAQVLFSTAKRPDGVLHAWKVLSLG
jgi:protocatechuate 3,4-dioxygenase beta subunit